MSTVVSFKAYAFLFIVYRILYLSAAFKCNNKQISLYYISLNIYRIQQPGGDYSSMLFSWSQFCKEPLPERTFTFWEWFYAVMKLTREHLKGPWMDG